MVKSESGFHVPGLNVFEGRINHAFSSSKDGNMSSPYTPVEDVRANRKRFLKAHGFSVDQTVWMNPIHQDHIAYIEPGIQPVVVEEYTNVIPGVDGLITRRSEHGSEGNKALAVTPGDCPIVIITNDEASVLAEVHAGRRGAELNVVGETLSRLAGMGVTPDQLIVGIGPSICASCYAMPYLETINPTRWMPFTKLTEGHATYVVMSRNESGEQKYDLKGNKLYRVYPEMQKANIQIDVQSFITRQITSLGVPEKNIEVSPLCTFELAGEGKMPSHYYSDTNGLPQSRFAAVAQLTA